MVSEAQKQADQELFVLFIIGVISTLVMLWALYWVIRIGVRDGMSDATRETRSLRKQPQLQERPVTTLPDMRAD